MRFDFLFSFQSTGLPCFIDHQKAFDTLDHTKLFNILERYEYRAGPIHEMRTNYLSNSLQNIDSNGNCRDQKE